MHRFTRGLAAALSLLIAVCSLGAQGAEPAAPAPEPPSVQQPQQQVPRSAVRKPAARARAAHRRVVPVAASNGVRMGLRNTRDELALKSSAAFVVDQDTGETIALKNADVVLPIASLTKLMMALVVVESGAPMNEVLQVTGDDVDNERHSFSRLTVGTKLTRDQMLLLALMSSENRAAMALSRGYPGGRPAFVAQMNRKAQALGMASTHFGDPAGLSNESVSTARDLHRLLSAAYAQPLIRSYTTRPESTVRVNGRTLAFNNSNRLVRKSGDWNIELQKTGFTNEAGRCLVMQATMLGRRLAMIFLDSTGTLTRYADAARVRRRIELDLKGLHRAPAVASATASRS